VFLRQLEYLNALARERHFGRAASACRVSQPALSAAIRNLERELGLPLVFRDQRYGDLTPEGRELLRWSQQAVASIAGLTSEAARLRRELTGTLRLGVIPTALLAVSLITGPLLDREPGTRVEVRSLSSVEIVQQLASHELDAGVTYLDNEPLGAVATTPIYHERYLFVTASQEPEGSTIGWASLAGVPLCLLTTDMQNRRIINGALEAAGVDAAVRVEANSISALLSFARAGRPCIMAETWLALHGLPPGIRGLKLNDPDITHLIGLVTPHTDLIQPIVRALIDGLASIDIDQAIDRGLRGELEPPVASVRGSLRSPPSHPSEAADTRS
jgi:DNA-binding transcriptional LysR family regulator